MTSPLLGSLAKTIGDAMSEIFLDAVLTRDVPGTIVDPNDPPAPTQTTFPCKAIEDTYGSFARGSGLVNERDVKVLILASTLATDPAPLDRITIRGRVVVIVPANSAGTPPIQSDPARATWECRCMS